MSSSIPAGDLSHREEDIWSLRICSFHSSRSFRSSAVYLMWLVTHSCIASSTAGCGENQSLVDWNWTLSRLRCLEASNCQTEERVVEVVWLEHMSAHEHVCLLFFPERKRAFLGMVWPQYIVNKYDMVLVFFKLSFINIKFCYRFLLLRDKLLETERGWKRIPHPLPQHIVFAKSGWKGLLQSFETNDDSSRSHSEHIYRLCGHERAKQQALQGLRFVFLPLWKRWTHFRRFPKAV